MPSTRRALTLASWLCSFSKRSDSSELALFPPAPSGRLSCAGMPCLSSLTPSATKSRSLDYGSGCQCPARHNRLQRPSPPWGRGWTAAGAFISRGGPGEGVPAKLLIVKYGVGQDTWDWGMGNSKSEILNGSALLGLFPLHEAIGLTARDTSGFGSGFEGCTLVKPTLGHQHLDFRFNW